MDMASDPAVTDGSMAPMFEVDPFWPKPLPNHWLLGSTIGVAVDSREHVWIIHRGIANLVPNEVPAAQDPPIADECCFAAPPVLEFDAEGNLVGSWGGPGDGYDWPVSNHGIVVDHMDNVWIGGNGGGDSHVLKFSRTGDFLLQVGEARPRPQQQRPEPLLTGRQGHLRRTGQRDLPGRWLRQQAGRRHRCLDRRPQAILGSLRQHTKRR